MESFSTVWARERSGIGVNEKMCRKCWRSFELFLTNMTFINLKINIIMILLVNLAKIRKSKLANHLVVWIWQKIVPVLELLQYVNLTLISGNFEKSWNPQRFFVFISLIVFISLMPHLYLPFLFFVDDRGCDCVDGPWKHFYFYKLGIHMKCHSVHDSFVYDARIELEDMFYFSKRNFEKFDFTIFNL